MGPQVLSCSHHGWVRPSEEPFYPGPEKIMAMAFSREGVEARYFNVQHIPGAMGLMYERLKLDDEEK